MTQLSININNPFENEFSTLVEKDLVKLVNKVFNDEFDPSLHIDTCGEINDDFKEFIEIEINETNLTFSDNEAETYIKNNDVSIFSLMFYIIKHSDWDHSDLEKTKLPPCFVLNHAWITVALYLFEEMELSYN